jgi:hypothetical protein
MQAQNQPFNFADFGQVVLGADNINYNHPIPESQRDEATQLPYHHPLSYAMSRILIPENLNIDQIHFEIITAIQDIEGIRRSWNAERAVWTIHYGTTPQIMQFTDYRDRMWFKRYLTNAHFCALEAQRKFPHLLDHEDDEDYETDDYIVMPPRNNHEYWGHYELSLSMSKETRKITLSFNRISNGSGYETYHIILNRLRNTFGKEGNWNNRKEFLTLEEGIKSVTTNAKDEDNNKLRYLFDYGIMREVCGFISGFSEINPNW